MELRKLFGFLPPKFKYFLEDLSIEKFPLAKNSILLINKDDKGFGELKLNVGDSLKSGQKIIFENDEICSFSSVTGVVEEIKEIKWADGKLFTAISIATAKDDDWDSSLSGEEDLFSKSSGELLSRLNECGFEFDNTKTVIVSALDVDLLVSVNQQIIREKSDNIQIGLKLLKQLVGSEKIILAVSPNLKDIAMKVSGGNAEVTAIDPVYPNGVPDLLAMKLLNNKGNIGDSVVIGTEYLNAMIESLKTGRPFVDKVITLIDKEGKPRKNIRARVGTPISEILKANNITVNDNDKLILGGPMQGKASYLVDFPITTNIDAIYVQNELNINEYDNTACINCGSCVSICPYNLQVNLISRYSEFSLFENCNGLNIDCCIECGLCAYVCRSRRPLVQFIQFAKNEINELRKEESVQ